MVWQNNGDNMVDPKELTREELIKLVEDLQKDVECAREEFLRLVQHPGDYRGIVILKQE